VGSKVTLDTQLGLGSLGSFILENIWMGHGRQVSCSYVPKGIPVFKHLESKDIKKTTECGPEYTKSIFENETLIFTY